MKKGFVIYRFPGCSPKIRKGNWKNLAEGNSSFIFTSFDQKSRYYINEEEQDWKGEEHDLFFNREEVRPCSREEYKTICCNLIERCGKDYDKIVLSRISREKRTSLPFQSLIQLFEKYPNTLGYLISIEGVGTWMGATPETLISRKNNSFVTISLAGTKKKDGVSEWSQKEYEEQQIVTDYILNRLNQIEIKGHASEVETIEAGKIEHLRSIIKFESDRATNEITNILHPTPAVCGTPLEKTYSIILEKEPHDRGFYTGYLGTLSKETSRLFVNLRCMQLLEHENILYVGGGITGGSNWEREWTETELKSKTMKSIM